MNLPTLYKRTKTGSIQYWKVEVSGNCVITEYGLLGTTSPQISVDSYSSGKNLGKSNETSIQEQVGLEALYKWKRQVRKGYREELETAKSGILPYPVPMLAHAYSKHKSKISFPAIVQPKLDGIRCTAKKEGDDIVLYSRNGRKFTSVPHIQKSLKGFDFTGIEFLDGELYNHAFKDNFEHLTHLIKQEQPDPKHTDVEYHVFDAKLSSTAMFKDRYELVKSRGLFNLKYIVGVDSLESASEDDIKLAYESCLESGYEGVMVRNLNSIYECSRSYNLLKYKEMIDSEYTIVDVQSGKGKLSDCGIFICSTPSGDLFSAKMKGNLSDLKEYLDNKDRYIGKLLTVQYQGISNKNKVPRFPVAVRIREEF